MMNCRMCWLRLHMFEAITIQQFLIDCPGKGRPFWLKYLFLFRIGSMPYGEVRWIGQVLTVDGNRIDNELQLHDLLCLIPDNLAIGYSIRFPVTDNIFKYLFCLHIHIEKRYDLLQRISIFTRGKQSTEKRNFASSGRM